MMTKSTVLDLLPRHGRHVAQIPAIRNDFADPCKSWS